MKTLGYYNGKYDELENMSVPMNDRVCWFGDGVYDAGPCRNYKIFAIDEHVDRFFNSAGLIKMQVPCTKAELKALQAQINPHFLYNTLEAIRGDALCEGIDSIADTTEALSTFFRYTITDTGNLVSVEDELENVENYFKIQQYRFGDKLDMRVNFPDDYARILECKLLNLLCNL